VAKKCQGEADGTKIVVFTQDSLSPESELVEIGNSKVVTNFEGV
jgi:hypothetical protein